MSRFSSKVKGIFRVSSSNLVSLGLSMMTSFVLPLFISVEQYGYWQLFVLYTGYVGFFVLGFNDGVQLNYATESYDKSLASKFNSFKRLLYIITIIESCLLLFISFLVFGVDSIDFYIAVLVIINILPSAIIGLFIYLNQSTLRFKEYSWCNIVDKIIFTTLMLLLIYFKQKSSLLYMSAYTAARFSVIIYCYYSDRLVFTLKGPSVLSLKSEIIKNFKDGFPLMIATVLGGPSIIVASRFLIDAKFGIDSFSSYSFALHTLIIAAQFITAVSTVFYPIFKRCNQRELNRMYLSFDKVTTLASIVLLLSYYPASLIVRCFYIKYQAILDYLYIIYPLFIYQCKVNVLVTNMYKVHNQPIRLIVVNSIGIVINIVFIFTAYYVFGTVTSIALGTLIGYILWYYLLQINTYNKENWTLKPALFADLFIVAVFIMINYTIGNYFDSYTTHMLISMSAYLLFCLLVLLIGNRIIRRTLSEFFLIMKD